MKIGASCASIAIAVATAPAARGFGPTKGITQRSAERRCASLASKGGPAFHPARAATVGPTPS